VNDSLYIKFTDTEHETRNTKHATRTTHHAPRHIFIR
jgi:hypothetical protein